MNKTLSWKLGLVVATLLVFLYGIFGIPEGILGQRIAGCACRIKSIWGSTSKAAPT